MKWKRVLALVLAAALACGLGVTALAVEVSSDQELMNITSKVKETLELDTEKYEEFSGWSNENVLLGKRWQLEWSGDGVSLSISADDKGKIYSLYRYESVTPDSVYAAGGRLNIPALPEDRREEGLEAANAFLSKVLTPGLETVELSDSNFPSLHRRFYSYYGVIRLNGLDSPIDCSLMVDPATLEVMRFWREDENNGYLGSVPSKDTKVTESQAKLLFKPTLDMEARYVLDGDGKTASVMYLPVIGDDYYVDGATGELVNLTELRKSLYRGEATFNTYAGKDKAMMEMPAPQAMAGGDSGYGALSQSEKDGAAKLNGARTKEELDAVLQAAWPELGLGKYTLANATYSVSERSLEGGLKEFDVTCRLVYGKQSGAVTANKYVTVDAKTGELKGLWSSRSSREENKPTYSVSCTVAQKTAEKFLLSFAGEDYGKLALSGTVDGQEDKTWQHSFTFAQKANGYFFPDNFYSVSVDTADGSITSLTKCFDPEVKLIPPADTVVSKQVAINAYLAAMAVKYSYLEVPVSISLAGSDLMPLLKENGYEYVTTLKTGYRLVQSQEGSVQGVDAVTGKAVLIPNGEVDEKEMTYDDLAGVPWAAEAAQALAKYKVGFWGGSLQPNKALTQLDMIILLLSLDGYQYDPATATQDDLKWLYEQAYFAGLVTPETRDEVKVITRGELVKLILNAAGYEKIASLPNIFRCDFTDADTIAEMGYAALAQGLGLVKGDSQGAYAGERDITRAEAVCMLYQYMKK